MKVILDLDKLLSEREQAELEGYIRVVGGLPQSIRELIPNFDGLTDAKLYLFLNVDHPEVKAKLSRLLAKTDRERKKMLALFEIIQVEVTGAIVSQLGKDLVNNPNISEDESPLEERLKKVFW